MGGQEAAGGGGQGRVWGKAEGGKERGRGEADGCREPRDRV